MVSPGHNDKVIAHYRDGSLLKGTTADFSPEGEKFTVLTADGDRREIRVAELKALFFVHDYDGQSDYHERKGFFADAAAGDKVLVEFADGEILFGHTHDASPNAPGFFMVPGDPDSNNRMIFVVRSATRRVKIKNGCTPEPGLTTAKED